MLKYKEEVLSFPECFHQKTWRLGMLTDEKNSLLKSDFDSLVCDKAHSHFYRKHMLKGISPLNLIRSDFGDKVPIFDFKFFHDIDKFIIEHPKEGLDLLCYVMFCNPFNVKGFNGCNSISIILNNLPESIEIFAFLVMHLDPDKEVLNMLYKENWISQVSVLCESTHFHFFLSSLLSSTRSCFIFDVPGFFRICEILLNSPIVESSINILSGFKNHLFESYPVRIAAILTDFINQDKTKENDILSLLFETLSKVVTEETIDVIMKVTHLLANIFESRNEIIIKPASDFAVSLISFEQGYCVLTSPEMLDIIFFNANDSIFSIKLNMILLLSSIVQNSNIEQICFLITKGVLDLLLCFLELDQISDICDILCAISFLLKSIDETDQIDYVLNCLIESENTLLRLADDQVSNISSYAESILKDMRMYMML